MVSLILQASAHSWEVLHYEIFDNASVLESIGKVLKVDDNGFILSSDPSCHHLFSSFFLPDRARQATENAMLSGKYVAILTAKFAGCTYYTAQVSVVPEYAYYPYYQSHLKQEELLAVEKLCTLVESGDINSVDGALEGSTAVIVDGVLANRIYKSTFHAFADNPSGQLLIIDIKIPVD
jgi:hypothetical protein